MKIISGNINRLTASAIGLGVAFLKKKKKYVASMGGAADVMLRVDPKDNKVEVQSNSYQVLMDSEGPLNTGTLGSQLGLVRGGVIFLPGVNKTVMSVINEDGSFSGRVLDPETNRPLNAYDTFPPGIYFVNKNLGYSVQGDLYRYNPDSNKWEVSKLFQTWNTVVTPPVGLTTSDRVYAVFSVKGKVFVTSSQNESTIDSSLNIIGLVFHNFNAQGSTDIGFEQCFVAPSADGTKWVEVARSNTAYCTPSCILPYGTVVFYNALNTTVPCIQVDTSGVGCVMVDTLGQEATTSADFLNTDSSFAGPPNYTGSNYPITGLPCPVYQSIQRKIYRFNYKTNVWEVHLSGVMYPGIPKSSQVTPLTYLGVRPNAATTQYGVPTTYGNGAYSSGKYTLVAYSRTADNLLSTFDHTDTSGKTSSATVDGLYGVFYRYDNLSQVISYLEIEGVVVSPITPIIYRGMYKVAYGRMLVAFPVSGVPAANQTYLLIDCETHEQKVVVGLANMHLNPYEEVKWWPKNYVQPKIEIPTTSNTVNWKRDGSEVPGLVGSSLLGTFWTSSIIPKLGDSWLAANEKLGECRFIVTDSVAYDFVANKVLFNSPSSVSLYTIAVSDNYIAYKVTGGKIEVVSRYDSSKTLQLGTYDYVAFESEGILICWSNNGSARRYVVDYLEGSVVLVSQSYITSYRGYWNFNGGNIDGLSTVPPSIFYKMTDDKVWSVIVPMEEVCGKGGAFMTMAQNAYEIPASSNYFQGYNELLTVGEKLKSALVVTNGSSYQVLIPKRS